MNEPWPGQTYPETILHRLALLADHEIRWLGNRGMTNIGAFHVILIVPLADSSVDKLTTALFRRPSKECLHDDSEDIHECALQVAFQIGAAVARIDSVDRQGRNRLKAVLQSAHKQHVENYRVQTKERINDIIGW